VGKLRRCAPPPVHGRSAGFGEAREKNSRGSISPRGATDLKRVRGCPRGVRLETPPVPDSPTFRRVWPAGAKEGRPEGREGANEGCDLATRKEGLVDLAVDAVAEEGHALGRTRFAARRQIAAKRSGARNPPGARSVGHGRGPAGQQNDLRRSQELPRTTITKRLLEIADCGVPRLPVERNCALFAGGGCRNRNGAGEGSRS